MLILQSRPRKNPQRVWLKRLGWSLIPIALVIAWLGYEPALQNYHLWKQARALKQAKQFIVQHDPDDAQLALEVAFTVAPGNIVAWREAADMLEQVGSPQAMKIRSHLVQMPGATLNDQVALINCDIRFRDYNAARDALGHIPLAEAGQPAALGAALSFAISTENAPIADALFDRIKAITPNNEDFKVAQSLLHLRHPDPKQAEAARVELQAAASNPKYALRVERELMSDAMLRRDFPAAKHWSAAALANPQAMLGDSLNQANLELLVDKRPFDEVFPPLAAKAAANPGEIASFVRWMLVQNHAAKADQWLSTLPAAVRNSAGVASAQAETVAQLQDWDRLAVLLEAGAWGTIPPESVRLAMSARVVGVRNVALQHDVWNEALQSSSSNLGALLVLERLASIWKWETESERTLWTIARTFPDQTWVHQSLFNAYRGRNDTSNMREVMEVLLNADPTVPRYQHDWALLSLLIDPTTEWNRPKEMMHQLYLADPTNPDYITGYAFALAQAGKASLALATINGLPPAELKYSPRAPYLAYIYGANGKKDEITQLESLAGATSFLPEERQLFSRARETDLHKLTPAPTAPHPKPADKS